MWPFKKKQLEPPKVFDDSYKPELKSIENEEVLLETEMRHIQYVMLFLEECELEQFKDMLSRIVDISVEKGAKIDTISANFIFMYLGAPSPVANGPDLRKELVDTLMSRFGKKLAMLHGQTVCAVGNFGTEHRMHYTAHLPAFKEKLILLTSLAYGQVVED